MIKCILTAAALSLSFAVMFGVNALKVTKDKVKTGVTEMLPTEFRQKISEREIADQLRELAIFAARLDRDVLPRYTAFLPVATYSELQREDFRDFRLMVDNFDSGSEKLATALRCLSESGENRYGEKKEQLEQLADDARADLKIMEDLKARVHELNELEKSLANALGSLNISKRPAALSMDGLNDVKNFISECEDAAAATRYEVEFQKLLTGGMNQLETEELSALMQTLELASH